MRDPHAMIHVDNPDATIRFFERPGLRPARLKGPEGSRHFRHPTDAGLAIDRPRRDGPMAFVKTAEGVPIALLQDAALPPAKPWLSMSRAGSW
ncbi:hypothetical protein RN629_03110 [Sphingomonadaceae bacterium jetA1]|jgi:catechol 2,3-dioxygenase-like lactoylglutathione lyase family enzyme|uniref:hypothetical protein n=1 Tax=Facivitalis istanbulensis TaxID=3075838 RepID=UPI00347993FB